MKKRFLTIGLLALAIAGGCSNDETAAPEPSPKADMAGQSEAKPDMISEATSGATSEDPTSAPSPTRSADSHTHGDASLAVVLEGSKVMVELDSPLYNLAGFEHAAETEAQKAAVIKAESILSDPAALFVFNSEAGCTASNAARSVEIDVEHGHEDHEGHDEEETHDDEHHDDDDHDEETHKDVTVQYDYACSSPDALTNVTVTLFEHFENLTELDLVYLGPNTQKQGKLTAAKPRMNLTR